MSASKQKGFREARFWAKVDVRGPNDCWPWRGARKPKGYGNARINKTYVLAHRAAWEFVHFPIPQGYSVCHICDNPRCCNPAHLMLGTTRSNFCDMVQKRRSQFRKNKATGARNINSKLDEAAVKAIRRKYQNGDSAQYELAVEFNVSPTTIGSIVRRMTWRHV